MLVKLSRTAAIDDLQDLDAFRGFAAAVNALVEASHARSSGECGYVVFTHFVCFCHRNWFANSHSIENQTHSPSTLKQWTLVICRTRNYTRFMYSYQYYYFDATCCLHEEIAQTTAYYCHRCVKHLFYLFFFAQTTNYTCSVAGRFKFRIELFKSKSDDRGSPTTSFYCKQYRFFKIMKCTYRFNYNNFFEGLIFSSFLCESHTK